MALYRKYRPATFAEVVGQEHVTDPLSTALDGGRISHAYLFSGPRGCGKTSSARILARSLNCVDGPTATPCGQCPSCEALGPSGAGNVDVIELDAASHGGVDDTRELRDRAFYAPAQSRYRVFIVDEAHMVTTAGFNALLKIVEEPPPHLIFVFATTEPDKVLPTIRSRTHHYPFRLLPPATMRGLLGRICEQERVPVEEAVYPLVIRAGGGSPRDSLSLLDQLLAGAGPDGITYTRAVGLLGVTDVALIDDAVNALAAGDGAKLFETVDRVMEAGHDPRRFATDLLERLRDLILLRAVPGAADRGLVAAPDDLLERMSDQAGRIGPASLTRFAELLHEGLGDMRGATAPRLLLEVVCARMLLPAASTTEPAALQRLEQLERVVSSGAAAQPGGTGAAAANVSDDPPPPRNAAATALPESSDSSRRRGSEALAAARESRATGAATPDVMNPPAGVESGGVPATADIEPEMDRPEVVGPSIEPGPVPEDGRGLPNEGHDSRSTDRPSMPIAHYPPVDPADAPANAPGAGDVEAPPGSSATETPPTASEPQSNGDDAVPEEQQDSAGTERTTENEASAVDPLAEVTAAWPDIKAEVRGYGAAIGAMVASGTSVVAVEAETVVFAHQHAALVERLSSQQNLESVRSAVDTVLGRDYQVRWVTAAAAGAQPAVGSRPRESGGRRSGNGDSGGADSERHRPGPNRAAGSGSGNHAVSGTGAGNGADPGTGAPDAASDDSAGGTGSPVATGEPPRFARPSRVRATGNPGNGAPDDDIPPPDYPDLPDDPALAEREYGSDPTHVPASTPEEEQEMLAESANPVPKGDRRDPDEVALELLAKELGATQLGS